MKTKTRRNLLRAGLVAALIALGFYLSVIGMYHTVILDNAEFSRDGAAAPALEGLSALVDGEWAELSVDDRIALSVKGSRTLLSFELSEAGAAAPKRLSYPLHLKSKKMIFVSVPAMVQGIENPFLSE